MTREIDLSFLLTVLKKAWWKIAVIVIAVAIVTALFFSFFVSKEYTHELQFYVVNNSSVSEYTSTGIVEAAKTLAQDYIRIINSDVSLEAISDAASEKGYDLTNAQVLDMISSKAETESSVFTIYITDENPRLAYDVALILKDIAPDIIKTISKPTTAATTDLVNETACVTVISNPVYHEIPSAPHVLRNTLLAALIALVGAYVAFFTVYILDVTIRDKEDIKKNIKAPLIGTIPSWESNSTSKGGK